MIRRLLYILTFSPLILLILVALLLGTPVGSHMVLALVDAAVPGLSLKYQGGKINRGLQLSDVRFSMDGILVEVDHIDASWRLRCLVNKTLCVDGVDAEGVRVAIDIDQIGGDSPDVEEPEPEIPSQPGPDGYTGMGLPLTILGQNLDLRNIDVRVDDMTYKAKRLRAAAQVGDTLIGVERLQLDGAEINIPLGDEESETSTTLAEPDNEPDNSWAMAHLPKVDLPFAIDVQQALAQDAHVQIGWMDHRVEHLSFLGTWQHTSLSVPHIEVRHNWANLTGRVWMDFDNGYGIDAEVEGEMGALPWLPELAGHEVHATAEGRLTDLHTTLSTKGALTADLKGQIELGLPTMPFNLQLDGKHLQWPLQGPAQFQADNLTLSAKGDWDRQEAQMSGLLTAEGYSSGQVELSVEHQWGELTVQQAKMDGEMGKAAIQGSLEYGDRLIWDASVSADGLDLSRLSPDLTLTLNGQASSKGYFASPEGQSAQWAIEVDDADLTGTLFDYPLQLQGGIALNSDWQGDAEQLRVAINQTTLEMDGAIVDGEWQLNGQLKADALVRWLPELTGSANATLQLTGPVADPKLDLTLTARRPGYDEYLTDKLEMVLAYWPRRDHQAVLNLTTGNLDLAGTELGPIRAQGRGNRLRQDLDISLFGDISAGLAMGGNYYAEEGYWRGAVLNGTISTPYGEWQTNLPAMLNYDEKRQALVLGEHCWQGSGVDLCLKGPALLGPKGAAALTLDAQVRKALKSVLPKRLRPKSRIQGEAYVSWQPGQLPYLKAELHDRDGSLVLRRGGGLPPSQIKWQAVDLLATLNQEGLALRVNTQIEDSRQVELAINLGPEAPYDLSGYFRSDALQLSPYLAWIPSLSDAQAVLSGDITFGGTLKAPELNGQFALTDGHLKMVVNPTELEDMDLRLNFSGQTVNVDGELQMGQGRADLTGDLNWANGLSGALNLKGDRLSILYPPMVVLEASPDMRFVLDPERLQIRGSVKVPEGSFTLSALPEGAVAVSDDVVYIDRQQESESPLSTHLDLDMDIQIEDRLKVKALGLTGNVGGKLTLRQMPAQPLQAYGDLYLKDGVFRAFGQRLTIRRGMATFNGPPALPNLDVEAVRVIESEDVTAGLRLTGTPASPQMTLFSNPAMEQQEILSYITRGRGLSSSDGGSALFASAALGLGVNTTQGVFTTIGEGLGFQNVVLDTESEGEDTQVTISGYLGKRLFLKYGVGVFGESINELTVRYYLLQRLWLEAVSAVSETTEQSLDLYYSFDID
ncbi:translocation/assembly module TamB domain-containing protein [Ferrimonas balearica]|uniref:autotransporter assembly complex protein TamB n=1 Tax=Ferrimonas balearica TaxID=44012 RepID=UPI001C99B02E|nr:translocation/assembly module TamB domain-containing protein [Ferrimonas balearica]MBY5920902.1 translocation/assembly module TamB [Ferrimonas balearica]MBY5996413.1 translocation/assembly module TamB [Ferrimonas balearica]